MTRPLPRRDNPRSAIPGEEMTHSRFIGILVIVLSAITSNTYAASVSVAANCGFRFFPTSTLDQICTGLPSTPIHNGALTASEEVNFVDPLIAYKGAQAGYAVTVADYGHFGALVHTYATHPTSSWGTGVEASAAVSMQYADAISISSATLAYGTVVPIELSYRITGDYGANRGETGYYAQNAAATLDGHVTLDWLQSGAVPPSHSTFHADTGSLLGDAKTGSFSISYNQTVYLAVGLTYSFEAGITMQSWSSVVAYQGCSDIGCNAGSYVDSSHSFFTYLTPQADGFQITSQSGHNYAITAVPEPAGYLLLIAGLASVWLIHRRLPNLRLDHNLA